MTERCYVMSNKKGYKCRNRECGKPFHALTHTLFSGSKIEYIHIFRIIYLYIKSRRTFTSYNYPDRSISSTNAIIMDLKLKDIFNCVEFIGKDFIDIFNSSLMNIFKISKQEDNIYDKNKYFSKKYKAIPDTDEIINFDNKETYNNCIILITRFLHYGISRNWYYLAFATPQEIMSETFLYIYENAESGVEVTNLVFIEAVKKTMQKMWYRYQMNSSKLKASMLRRAKRNKQDAIRNLKKRYVKELLKLSKKYKDTFYNIDINEEIEKYKNILIEKRKKRNFGVSNHDFISHF